MDHSEYQRRRQSRGVCGIRPATMNSQSLNAHQQRRQPLAELDSNRRRVHPGLGPLVPLAEAQARNDIRMRGFLPAPKVSSDQQLRTPSKTVSDAFPVAVPKRKPVPSRPGNRVDSIEVGRPEQIQQLKRRPVSSLHKPDNGGEESRDSISTINPGSGSPSSRQHPLSRRPVQVLVAPFQTPRKIWKKLEIESQGVIEAWPNSNVGSPSTSPGKVWRRLEAETDGAIETWSRDVSMRRQP